MSTNSSHQTEIGLSELIGVFILVFWPVSLIAALLESPFYDAYSTIPINLALGSLAGLIAVKKYRANMRHKDKAM